MSNKYKNIYDYSIKIDNDYYYVNGNMYKRVDIDIDIENFANTPLKGSVKIPSKEPVQTPSKEPVQTLSKEPVQTKHKEPIQTIITTNNSSTLTESEKTALNTITQKQGDELKKISFTYNNINNNNFKYEKYLNKYELNILKKIKNMYEIYNLNDSKSIKIKLYSNIIDEQKIK